MNSLDNVIANGTHSNFTRIVKDTHIICADGFKISVIAGGGTYCAPRPAISLGGLFTPSDGMISSISSDYTGPYTKVECGFPSERPEPWDVWSGYAEDSDSPTETVYGYVPVDMVRALLDLHGGEQRASRED